MRACSFERHLTVIIICKIENCKIRKLRDRIDKSQESYNLVKHGEENGGDVVEKMLLVIPLLRDVLHYGIDEIKNRQLLIGGDLNDEHFVSNLHLQNNMPTYCIDILDNCFLAFHNEWQKNNLILCEPRAEPCLFSNVVQLIHTIHSF